MASAKQATTGGAVASKTGTQRKSKGRAKSKKGAFLVLSLGSVDDLRGAQLRVEAVADSEKQAKQSAENIPAGAPGGSQRVMIAEVKGKYERKPQVFLVPIT